MLCDRMESNGLDLWKANITSTDQNEHTRTRLYNTDKLDMICDTIKDFTE